MRSSFQLSLISVVLAGLSTTACTEMREPKQAKEAGPAHVEPVRGTNLNLVRLTEKAIERIDLRTDKVREQSVSRSNTPRTVVPYSALIYDSRGDVWVYTMTSEPRTFVRHKVDIDYIEGEIAVLNAGPAAESIVASVGVAELYGTEFHVGH